MRKSWQYLIWTIPWLAAAVFVFYLKKQPVPQDWLLSNLSAVEFIKDFKKSGPIIKFWNENPIKNLKLNNFSILSADRVYAYLSQESLTKLNEYYSPAKIESCVRRVKTILISPCSFELKNKALRDPLQFSTFIKTSFEQTNNLQSIFVFTHGENEEEALFNAEKAYKQLEKLKSKKRIGQIQSICSFLVSPERQILLMEKFNIKTDVFKWLAEFEKAVENESLRQNIFRAFVENMRKIKESKKEILSVERQKQLMKTPEGYNLDDYFFFDKSSNDIYCVTKVFIPENISMDDAKDNILETLQSKRVKAFVSGEEFFCEKYYQYLRNLLSGIFLFWAFGFLVIFVSRLFETISSRVLFGKSADFFFLDKKNYPCLANNKLKKFEAFILLERTAAENKNVSVEVIRKHRKRRDGSRRRIDKISINDEKGKTSVFYIKRGTGRKTVALEKELSAIMRMKKAGLPAPDVAAYGEGNWHGLDQAFFVLPELKGYVPLYDLQTKQRFSLYFKRVFLKELARVVRNCHDNSIYNVQWFAKHIFIKESADGSINLKLIDLEDVYPQSFKIFIKKCIIPFWAKKQKLKELVHLNTQLFPKLFSVEDRTYFYKSYAGKRNLSEKDNRLVSKIFKLSNMKGFSQYTTKSHGIYINLGREDFIKKLSADSFDGFMKIEGGETVTKKRGRTVVAFNVENSKLFLKRHTKTKFFDSLKELLKYKKPVSNAGLEWKAISELKTIGINTMPALAMGERFRWKFWEKQSFLLTEEIKNGKSLEKILENNPAVSFKARKDLAERIGEIARKLHSAGFVHRDFYLGHFYVVGDLNGEYKLHLIDLQRVMPGAKIYNRWSLKDISALYFSSLPLEKISRSDRMRFLFNYLGIKKLDRKSRQFIYKIMMKSYRIEKHTKKLINRRIKRGELPAKQG